MSTATAYSHEGIAHLTYSGARMLVSFGWDGCAGHPVEVEDAGYGEPVLALVLPDEGDLPHGACLTPAKLVSESSASATASTYSCNACRTEEHAHD